MTARHVLVYPARSQGDATPEQGLLVQWEQRDGDQWWALVATVRADGHLEVQWRHQSALRAATPSGTGPAGTP